MEKETPKPYLQLGEATILEHTIRRFLALEDLRQVIVSTSSEYLDRAEEILAAFIPEDIRFLCIEGGETRQHSISNALDQVGEVDLVLVHDAVRPFVAAEHIQACCRTALEVGGAVLGVPAKDTIKRIDEDRLIRDTPSRKFLWQTQTPQVFQKALLVRAYGKARKDNFVGTDDSSLVERLGREVKMVEGDRSNFKITYPLDLTLAELLISKQERR